MRKAGVGVTMGGAPSAQQRGGLVGVALRVAGRLTMPVLGRICSGRMLGDWNKLSARDQNYWMEQAQRTLESLSLVLPVYDLRLSTSTRPICVWYWRGHEPEVQLLQDLELSVDDG